MNLEKKNCIHCGTPIPLGWASKDFCCLGCQYVYQLIHQEGLTQYYDLKDEKTAPLLGFFRKKKSLNWIKPLLPKTPGKIQVQLQGVQCAACVWLIQSLAKKMGGANVSVNTAHGVLGVSYADDFPIVAFLETLQNFGYEPSFLQAEKTNNQHGLLVRLGICFALSMNAMMFSASFYTGLSIDESPKLYHLMGHLNFVIATLAVLIGGSYFLSRAFKSLLRGILHFDLPISLGLSLAYLGSVYCHFSKDFTETYFDTVTVFITLMLLGRFIQERMIARNKSRIVQDQTLDHFSAKVITDDQQIQDIALNQVKKGMRLLLHPSTIVPVDAILIKGEPVEIDTSWITGEPYPKMIAQGQVLEAGSIVLGNHAVEVQAQTDFAFSQLSMILTQAQTKEELSPFWSFVSKYYVFGVLFFVTAGFLFWYLQGDLIKAVSVAVAISVVTCPCSLGIAVPLSRTLAYRKLMAQGILIQQPYTLDQLRTIKNIAFDKTGTLTMSDLKLSNPQVIDTLSLPLQQMLFNATARSYHPASRAIFEYLTTFGLAYQDLEVKEIVGQGLEVNFSNKKYFIGRTQKKQQDQRRLYSVEIMEEERSIAVLELIETLQENTPQVIQKLMSDGYELYLISGDQEDRVEALGRELGFKKENVFAQQSPLQKQNILERLNQNPTLYIGDGLNDQLALEKATVSALALSGQLQMSQKAHIFYISQTLEWVTQLFSVSLRLKKVLYFNLRFLVVYNAITVGLAFQGWITPLVCAIIMPLSSLWVIFVTTKRLKT